MRPVDKGVALKTYTNYKKARDDLIDRIGCICSYCEMPINNSAEVEHVIPKNYDKTLELKWENFLLSCTYCNSTKNDRNQSRDEYIFPDEDNTALAFIYSENKIIEPSKILTDKETVLARNTISLMRLDRDKEEIAIGNYRDTRWLSRQNVWNEAKEWLNDYKDYQEENIKEFTIKKIKSVVNFSGFFSIWMTVFKDYPEVKNAIINGVKGTAVNCFDQDGNPKRGVRGKI
jgi:uncharacterized protein (TIGR02646 family)